MDSHAWIKQDPILEHECTATAALRDRPGPTGFAGRKDTGMRAGSNGGFSKRYGGRTMSMAPIHIGVKCENCESASDVSNPGKNVKKKNTLQGHVWIYQTSASTSDVTQTVCGPTCDPVLKTPECHKSEIWDTGVSAAGASRNFIASKTHECILGIFTVCQDIDTLSHLYTV